MRKKIVFLWLLLMLALPCLAQMKIAVLEPEGKGLSKGEQWMLSLIQSSITGDFNKYSGMTIIDRQNLEKIIAEQKRSLSAMTSDEDAIQIGNLANASHVLSGKITKTPNAFMLELAVTDVESGVRKASYSPRAVTPRALENLSALKEASADLLKQLGVNLTSSQLAELRGPVTTVQIQAQTALAHGVVAQRQGTEVAAQSYFYQAAALDASLIEATSRSKVISANISSGNIGADVRNDIAWRKNWVAKLAEFEEFFSKIIDASNPPYTLFYCIDIQRGNINYQKETIDLSIKINLSANAAWMNSIEKSANAVYGELNAGLNSTNRRKEWGLGNWPQQGVTNSSPFASYRSKQHNISVEFKLLNDRKLAIGKQTLRLSPAFSLYSDNDRIVNKFTENNINTVAFNAVNANDITDNLAIRIASVNGAAPENAGLQITALSALEFGLVDKRDNKIYKTVRIGKQVWMAENLNYNEGGSKCYNNSTANCDKYGRLYNWNTAIKVCPSGWHLPTDAEWAMLENAAGGKTAGKQLKAKSGWGKNGNGTDAHGFAALPGGYGGSDGGFDDAGYLGYWWSSTEDNAYYAYNRRMYYDNEYVNRYNNYKTNLFSVRCLQDSAP